MGEARSIPLYLRTLHRIYSIYIILSFLTGGVEGEDLPGPDPASCRIESGRAGALIRRRRRLRPGSCFSHCPEIRVTFPQSRTASHAAARALVPVRSRPRLTEHDIQ